MNQRDFNRQMDNYLRSRRAPSGGKGLLGKLKGITVTIEDDEPPRPKPEPVMEEPEPVVVEAEPEDVEYEETAPRQRFWHRWFRRVSKGDRVLEEVEEIEKPKVDEDVREMLKISVRWINMSPPDVIQEIKRSDDYVRFKDLLDKYGLLKK